MTRPTRMRQDVCARIQQGAPVQHASTNVAALISGPLMNDHTIWTANRFKIAVGQSVEFFILFSSTAL